MAHFLCWDAAYETVEAASLRENVADAETAALQFGETVFRHLPLLSEPIIVSAVPASPSGEPVEGAAVLRFEVRRVVSYEVGTV